MGVSMAEVFNTLQVYLGSLYVNDFNRFGRTWQVNVQADGRLPQPDRRSQAAQDPQRPRADGAARHAGHGARRQRPGDDHALQHVSRGADQRQPGRRASARARRSNRWNSWSSDELPWSMRYEWTELALLQLQTGNTAMLVFLLAVVLVFLVLAAQYESWSLPLAVILVVPMCLLCSIAGVQCGPHGHQHLHAGRLRGAGRPGVQERDPDRRIRQGPARGRARSLPGHAGSLQAAVAADRDDVVRLHPGRGAAGVVDGAAPKCAARWARPCSAACWA